MFSAWGLPLGITHLYLCLRPHVVDSPHAGCEQALREPHLAKFPREVTRPSSTNCKFSRRHGVPAASMARTKAPTGARRPPGALPRRARALMAAMPSTQEMQEHALPSDTEEESIFPAEEVCAEIQCANAQADGPSTPQVSCTCSQGQGYPAPEQVIKLSGSVTGCASTS